MVCEGGNHVGFRSCGSSPIGSRCVGTGRVFYRHGHVAPLTWSRTHTRNAHHNAPRRGGVYALQTLGRMHHLVFQQGGGNIDVLVVDILPNFPGRSSTLSGGMRNVYDILNGFSPSARALLVRTAVGLVSEMSTLHNQARVNAGLPPMPAWATMGAFARDSSAAYGGGPRMHMAHMEVCYCVHIFTTFTCTLCRGRSLRTFRMW